MSKTTFTVADDKKTLLVERTFNAPKHKLWNAYTDADALAQWWGPIGWETEVKRFDFSEGGEWLYIMKCVDENQGEWFGQLSAGKAVYSNIQPEDSFEYTDYFTDEQGVINEAMPASRTVLTLNENEDGSTKLVTKTAYDTEAALKQVLEMGMEEGFGQTLDRLDDFVRAA